MQLQPPSGGCVLKPKAEPLEDDPGEQPPSGGCVLKHRSYIMDDLPPRQPPSGGCVLKPALALGLRKPW